MLFLSPAGLDGTLWLVANSSDLPRGGGTHHAKYPKRNTSMAVFQKSNGLADLHEKRIATLLAQEDRYTMPLPSV